MAEVVSEMAGVIAQVLVKEGDTVSAGQDVVILESMKMQIPIQATAAGTVKKINVQAGDFVNQGDPVLVLE